MVTICDVGPYDGLQNEAVVLEPAVRAELVNRLAGAGLRAIEAVSFVHPERVPQMARAEQIVAGSERLLHGEGVQTGVDRDAFIGVSEWLESVLGRELPGQLYRAGAYAPLSG